MVLEHLLEAIPQNSFEIVKECENLLNSSLFNWIWNNLFFKRTFK